MRQQHCCGISCRLENKRPSILTCIHPIRSKSPSPFAFSSTIWLYPSTVGSKCEDEAVWSGTTAFVITLAPETCMGRQIKIVLCLKSTKVWHVLFLLHFFVITLLFCMYIWNCIHFCIWFVNQILQITLLWLATVGLPCASSHVQLWRVHQSMPFVGAVRIDKNTVLQIVYSRLTSNDPKDDNSAFNKKVTFVKAYVPSSRIKILQFPILVQY